MRNSKEATDSTTLHSALPLLQLVMTPLELLQLTITTTSITSTTTIAAAAATEITHTPFATTLSCNSGVSVKQHHITSIRGR